MLHDKEMNTYLVKRYDTLIKKKASQIPRVYVQYPLDGSEKGVIAQHQALSKLTKPILCAINRRCVLTTGEPWESPLGTDSPDPSCILAYHDATFVVDFLIPAP